MYRLSVSQVNESATFLMETCVVGANSKSKRKQNDTLLTYLNATNRPLQFTHKNVSKVL